MILTLLSELFWCLNCCLKIANGYHRHLEATFADLVAHGTIAKGLQLNIK